MAVFFFDFSLSKPKRLLGLMMHVKMVIILTCVITSMLLQNALAQNMPLTTSTPENKLPPVSGKAEPRSMPVKGEDGIYHHSWFKDSFLDLRDDIAEANEAGKQVVLFVEMNGCPYCQKLQQNIMSAHYIKTYVNQNFHAISINIHGDKSATDVDGKEMTESKLMKRWGIRMTPTIIFLPTELDNKTNKTGRQLAVIPPVLPARYTADGLYDLFVWVKTKGYHGQGSFRDFYSQRQAIRDGLTK